MPILEDILEASLRELLAYQAQGDFAHPEHSYYVDVLVSYLQVDRTDLSRLKQLSPPKYLDLVEIRWALITESLSLEFLRKIEQSEIVPELEGERAFVLGLAYLDLNLPAEARRSFQLAHRKLWSQGAKKKAVKGLLNVVVSEDRLDNNKKCIPSYEYVRDRALEVRDPIVAGLCSHNIAKEYAKLGAFELSLRFSNEALDLLYQDRGVNHFYEALLQRCHTLIELERYHEALIDFQTAKASNHERIREALKALEVLLGETKEVKLEHLEPAWRTKLLSSKALIKREKLTKLEEQFVAAISKGPVLKEDLVSILYGDRIDLSSADNRLNVFLTRFKKKYPGTIVSSELGYSLVDNTLLEGLSHEA